MPLGTKVGLGLRDIVLDGDPAPPPLKGQSHRPNFRPMSVVAKRLDGLRCHLVWRQALAQVTLCSMGIQLLTEKRAPHPHPIFGPCLLWLNGWMDQDATWYGGTPRPRRRCVRSGRSSPKRGTAPPRQFWVHVYCGQAAGWMKTPLGTEVDLGPGHCIRRGPSSPRKTHISPSCFRPMSIVATIAHLSYC